MKEGREAAAEQAKVLQGRLAEAQSRIARLEAQAQVGLKPRTE